MAGQGDSITSTAGDDGKIFATGKGIDQTVTDNRNVVNVYPDRNNPDRAERNRPITLDERLDRLERNDNEHQKMLERMKSLVDGNPENRFVGLLDQLEATSRNDLAWKQATEKRVLLTEGRLDKLEENKDNKKYPVESSIALLVVIIFILLAVIVVMGLSRLQNAGQGAVAISLLQMAVITVQGNWRGTII